MHRNKRTVTSLSIALSLASALPLVSMQSQNAFANSSASSPSVTSATYGTATGAPAPTIAPTGTTTSSGSGGTSSSGTGTSTSAPPPSSTQTTVPSTTQTSAPAPSTSTPAQTSTSPVTPTPSTPVNPVTGAPLLPGAQDSATGAAPLVNFAHVGSVSWTSNGPADAQFQKLEKRYDAKLLGNPHWHGFLNQEGRTITVNLYYLHTINGLSIQMEQDPKAGIFYPSHVDFEVNLYGKWYMLGSVPTKIPQSASGNSTQWFAVQTHDLQASEFRIVFPVTNWVFTRNLGIWGSDFSVPTSQSLPNLPQVPKPFTQMMTIFDPRSAGIRNMMLAYSGSYGQMGTWTAKDFLPVTSYLLQNGQIGGRLFDTVLFLPYTLAQNQQAWLSYLNNLFAQNEQLSALNQAMAKTDQGMNKFGYNPYPKEKVVIALPYPSYHSGAWGLLGGQILSFKPTASDPGSVASRLTAIQWYLNTFLAKWKQAGFSNLSLAGFYLNDETVHYTFPGEVSLIQGTSQMVHKAGYPLFWIPFYDAGGIEDWQSLGINAAWIQPNYAIQGKAAPAGRVANTVQLAKDNGMGVELELPTAALISPLYRNLYLSSLHQFQQAGATGSVSHAMYAGSKVLTQAAYSTNPAVRALYDQTYAFLANQSNGVQVN
ncbi:DUF4855 domain-containing protein [Ferroacidibacillus organovorans]|uniref:DUF4855 domain-containing protein n=1 Tax=Ferroacidibacillus organovorans TaxID=1765683 RepID=A0A101XPA3_9BACL|nr:DUF4855 domain-containing protein [Ferroacidibacillus organovorans]KUO94897.1 hypothetical protein ATW55_15505 [Ferroacidibacillus organovorans]